MAGKKAETKMSAIEVIDETEEKKKKGLVNVCPICGALNGRQNCKECGFSIEELGSDYDIGGVDPVTAVRRAESTFKSAKKEIKDLKEQNKALLVNNQKFSELVERMELQMKTLRADTGKKYVYSFQGGGWGQLGDIDPRSLHIKKKVVNINDINRQLAEIMKLLKRYKK